VNKCQVYVDRGPCGKDAASASRCLEHGGVRRPTDDQQHALQEQRHREALAVEMAGLRADAERARWCEEMKADVKWSMISNRWHVSWVVNGDYYAVNRDDRNTAIDRAMQEGK